MELTVRPADYEIDFEPIRAIRFAVFVDEQSVPPEIELDDRDPHCHHFLALDDGMPVGTARIDLEANGKVGRLAVLATHRRHGVGRLLMFACESFARENGVLSLWCNAQVSAVPFYESIGYRTTGPIFDEAGIDHIKMEKR